MVGAAVLALTVSVAARIPWLAARVSARAVGAVAAMPAVAGYAWLTSPGAPILRSAIMAELYLVAIAVRRRFDFPTALAVAAVVVGLFEPDAPWDVSAQLSFVTILWIWSGMRLLEGAPAQRPRGRRRLSLRVATAALAAVTASALATLGSSPILAWHFGEVSVVGIVANPIVVPLMGWGALGCGLVGLVLAPLTAAVSSPAFWLSGLCVRLSLAVATALSDLPWAVVPVGWRTALICSTVVTCGALPAPCFRHRIGRALGGAVLASALAIAASDPAPPLRVSFLDVGQGDAALVELGADLRFTVDGGGLARGREPGDRVLLPALRRRGIERLDGSVVSHPEWDHFGGIGALVREGKTAAVWWAGRRGESGAWRRFERALAERGIPLRVARAGPFPSLARAHGTIDVLHPATTFEPISANDSSLVFVVRYGASSVLFTGDIEAQGEAALLARSGSLGATVVKVPHHGSATSSGTAFVRGAAPALAVASLGRGNAFRFPADAVVERYRRVGSQWAGTDRAGEVIVESDGQLMRVERCRPVSGGDRPSDPSRW